MINTCNCSDSTPIEAGMVSCQNIKCLEFDIKYFIWEWQKLSSDDNEETRLRKMIDTNTD